MVPDPVPGADRANAAAKRLLRRAFEAALAAADPGRALLPHLPEPPAGRTLVVGAGKAAARMAAAVDVRYAGAPLSGLAIVPYGHAASGAGRVAVAEAGHPVPDAAGVAATERVLALARAAAPDDRLLVLLSGGGSALLTAPAGVTLAEKAEATRRLLASGADIGAINVVRKHLSRVKGGRLAALARAPSLTLALSDVVGDDPATIASGPTVPDPSTYAEALAVVERYAPELTAVRAALTRGAAGAAPESPKPGDPRLARAGFRLVGGGEASLAAAARVVEAAGYAAVSLGAGVQGEARRVGREHAALAARLVAHGRRVALLSGGELTVTVHGARPGRGGPNGEYALAFAAAAAPGARYALLAADTDGIDGGQGPAAPAGALLGPAEAARLTPDAARAALAAHGSHDLLARVGGLLVTGPTGTNVNDLRVVLLEG